ncbi:histone H2A dioxygenase-like protein [Oopsacas minuta]|uniref:Histone H2A dioxygenase-like protein n=1 Tax=Oopsacas minuta TaxID=111878 RepID=A0AAV7K6R9_9METZ|nr:histone H2A dioxygenase-like protein [Oopsacas minuta]
MCAAKYPNNEIDTTDNRDNTTPFDTLFKLYKKKVLLSTLPAPIDLPSVTADSEWSKHLKLLKLDYRDDFHHNLGLNSPLDWDCYTLPELYPGLMYIPNIFKEGCQYPWVWRAISAYNCLPNKCNIDAHIHRSDRKRLWNAVEWTDINLKEGIRHKMRDNLMYQLRWTTLGYQYDWTSKVYREKDYSPIPEELIQLFQYIANVFGYKAFKLEAGIINYYHIDSTLSGHIDQSEFNLDAPLFSLSFGQPAVFLVGGATKMTKPVPLLLHSGDLVAMTGPTRLAYHAIPRIIKQESDTKAVTVIDDTSNLIEELRSKEMYGEVEAVKNYMEYSRINMNIREVGVFPKT